MKRMKSVQIVAGPSPPCGRDLQRLDAGPRALLNQANDSLASDAGAPPTHPAAPAALLERTLAGRYR